MVKLKSLDEQVMLVTGASSGIGLLTAQMAAERGAKVMLVARNRDALAEAVRGIEAAGGAAAYAVADVGEIDQLRAAATEAVARFGRIDTWVNNAGVAIYAPLLETPADEHERLFRTNYFGVVNGSLVAVEHLRDSGGALITVNSIAGDIPSPILGAYTASKHAAKAFIESLRIELGAADVPITLTLVKPSGMATPIGRHAANHLEGEAKIPPPAYDPHLVARAILDCAGHPRREVTVGGAGRVQVLFGTHFPALFEKLAPLLVPMLSDPGKPKTRPDNLDHAGTGGQGEVEAETMLRHSAYTASKLHPLATGLIVAAGAAVATAIVRKSRATA